LELEQEEDGVRITNSGKSNLTMAIYYASGIDAYISNGIQNWQAHDGIDSSRYRNERSNHSAGHKHKD